MGEKHLDIRSLFGQSDSSLLVFDPGFSITGSCASTISYADQNGKLLYRGYRIEELVEKSTYTEVCYLLLYGELPSKEELTIFEDKMYVFSSLSHVL